MLLKFTEKIYATNCCELSRLTYGKAALSGGASKTTSRQSLWRIHGHPTRKELYFILCFLTSFTFGDERCSRMIVYLYGIQTNFCILIKQSRKSFSPNIGIGVQICINDSLVFNTVQPTTNSATRKLRFILITVYRHEIIIKERCFVYRILSAR